MKFDLPDASVMNIRFISTATREVLSAKLDNEGKQKMSNDNRPLLSGNDLVWIKMEDGRQNGKENNAYISLINQPEGGIRYNTEYKAVGKIWMNAYSNSGGGGTSMVVETIVPANNPKQQFLKNNN